MLDYIDSEVHEQTGTNHSDSEIQDMIDYTDSEVHTLTNTTHSNDEISQVRSLFSDLDLDNVDW